jgi:hypothetical protein
MIEFRDTSPQFRDPRTHFAIRSISQWCDVVIGSPGDICIYSCFGESHREFDGPKIHIIGENVRPNFEEADFVIGTDRISNPKYLRYPYWAWRSPARWLMKPSSERAPEAGGKFCAFVYTNPRCEPRNQLFHALHARKFVEAPGKLFNNTIADLDVRQSVDWRDSKIEYLKQFQFVIAAENSRHRGYITEKITDAFKAGAIPIYWGDLSINRDFNPGSFVNANDFSSFESLADFVIALGNDSEKMAEMRSVAPMSLENWQRNAGPLRVHKFLHRAVTELVPRLAGHKFPES